MMCLEGRRRSRYFHSTAGNQERLRPTQAQTLQPDEVTEDVTSSPEASPASNPLDAHPVRLEGIVKSILFEAKDTGYRVLNVEIRSVQDAQTAFKAPFEGASASSSGEGAKGGTRKKATKAPKPAVTTTYVVGQLPEVQVGFAGVFAGSWTNHDRFGRQLSVAAFDEIRPTDAAHIVEYLRVRCCSAVNHRDLFLSTLM